MATDEHVLGYHVAAVFGGCDKRCLDDPDLLLEVLRNAGAAARYTVVGQLGHAFDPSGVTCALILAQSHLIGHSWPEYDAFVVDLFSCGSLRSVDVALAEIRLGVRAEWMTTTDVETRSFRQPQKGAVHE